MQEDFNNLRNFNYAQSQVYLWVFKKSTTASAFKAKYVQVDQVLEGLLQNVAMADVSRIIEYAQYTYLAQTNENSCLHTPADNGEFSLLRAQVDQPEPDNRSESIKDLKGAEGYVVKFVHNGATVYAVKRSTSTWKTSYPRKYINMIFRDGELAAAENNGFSIERNFDFYCSGNTLFIANKRAFESVLQHKDAYTQAFGVLQSNRTFSALFTSLQPLIDYVGNNSIQLRRIATVEQKGLYARPNFLQTVQQVNVRRNWGLRFHSQTSQLIPCEQTVQTIMKVLLDHKLLSEVTNNTYDVPDATETN